MDLHFDRGARTANRGTDLVVRQAVEGGHQQRRALGSGRRNKAARVASRSSRLPAMRSGPGAGSTRPRLSSMGIAPWSDRRGPVDEQVPGDCQQIALDADQLDVVVDRERSCEGFCGNVLGKIAATRQVVGEAEDVERVSGVQTQRSPPWSLSGIGEETAQGTEGYRELNQSYAFAARRGAGGELVLGALVTLGIG